MAAPAPNASARTRTRFSLSLAKGSSLFSFKAAPNPSSTSLATRTGPSQTSVNGPSSPRDPIYRADTLSPPVSAIIRATPSPPLSVTSSAFLPPPRSSTPPPIRLQHASTEQDMTGSPSSSAFDVSSIAFEREDIPVAPGDSSADTSMSAPSTAPGHGDNGRQAEEDDELDGRVLAAIEQELTKSTRRAPLATSTPARVAATRAVNDVKSPANATVATARGLAAPTPRRPASLARSSNGTSRPPSAAPRSTAEDDYRRPTPEFMLTASAAVPPTTSPTLGLSVDGNGSGNGSGSGNDTDMTGSHYSQPASATASASGSMPPPQSASQRILDAIRTTRLAPPSGPISPISATASLSSDGTLARGSDSGSVRNKGRVGVGSAQLVPGSTSTRRVASDGSDRGQARGQALETEVESSPWTIGANGRRAVSGQAASRPVSTGEFGETLRPSQSASTSARRPSAPSVRPLFEPPAVAHSLVSSTSRSSLDSNRATRPSIDSPRASFDTLGSSRLAASTDAPIEPTRSGTMPRTNADLPFRRSVASSSTFTRSTSESNTLSLGLGASQQRTATSTNPTPRPLGINTGPRSSSMVGSGSATPRTTRFRPLSQVAATPQSSRFRYSASSTLTGGSGSASSSLSPDTYGPDPDRENSTWHGPRSSASRTPQWSPTTSRSSEVAEDDRQRHAEELERLRLTHARETSALLSALADAQSRVGGVDRREHDALRAECGALRAENEALRSEFESARMECDDAVQARETLAGEHDALRRMHSESLQARAALEEEHEALLEEHQVAIASHDQLQAELQALTALQSAPHPAMAETQAELDALSEAYDSLSSSHSQLDASHTALTAEFTQLAAAYERLEHEHAELNDAHEGLVEGYGDLVRVHERVSAGEEVGRMREELEDAVAAARVLREENASLRVRIREVERMVRMAESSEDTDVSRHHEAATGGQDVGNLSSSSAVLAPKPGRRPVLVPKRTSSYGPGLSSGGPMPPGGGSTKQLRLVSGATTARGGSESEHSFSFDLSFDGVPVIVRSDGERSGESGETVKADERENDENLDPNDLPANPDRDRDLEANVLDPRFFTPMAAPVPLPAHSPSWSDLPSGFESPVQLEREDRIGRPVVPRNGTFGGDLHHHLFSIPAPEAHHATHLTLPAPVARLPSEDPSFAIPAEADGMSLLVMQHAQLDASFDVEAETDGEADVVLPFGRDVGRFRDGLLESGRQTRDPSPGALGGRRPLLFVSGVDADEEPTAKLDGPLKA